MHKSELNKINELTEAGTKKTWLCPVIIELNSEKTLSDDFYQDDGYGPGSILS